MNYYKYSKMIEHNHIFFKLIMEATTDDLFTKQTHRLLAVYWLTWYRKFAKRGNAIGRKDNIKYFIEEIKCISSFSK